LPNISTFILDGEIVVSDATKIASENSMKCKFVFELALIANLGGITSLHGYPGGASHSYPNSI